MGQIKSLMGKIDPGVIWRESKIENEE